MWRLVAERAGGDTYYILTGTDYVVGRKNCAILIPDDQSISRCHATLSVSYPSASLSQTNAVSVLTIKDSSKYGTTVSGERMQPAVPRSLKPSDEVIFGCFHSKYRVEYEPLVVCSSCLDNTEKNSLKQNLIHLGGHMLNNWTEKCTHLVMTSIKVTIKTICALICCKPIIKPDYFRELINAIQQKRPLPEYRSFIPPIDEPSLNPESLDLSENVKRKSIFKDKVFLFLNTKQYMKLSPAVLLGGGKAHLLESLTDTSVLENSTTCVIDVAMTETQLSETQSTQPWISCTLDLLHSKGLRAIPEAEIGLAVINVSTEIYCNPRRLAASGNEAETSKRTQVLSSTLSQGMTVDETVLPAPALNMTAYVADTEPQDQTDTGMNISGVREVKETPGSSSSHSRSRSCIEKEPKSGSSNDLRQALFQGDKTETRNKNNHPLLPIKPSARDVGKTSQKLQPTKKIDSYFQSLAKKRDRDEDEKEVSSAKLARVEPVSSQNTEEQFRPITEALDKEEDNFDSDLDMELAMSCDQILMGSNKVIPEDPTMKKRKVPDDHVVEESDIDSDEGISANAEQNDTESNLNKTKKRKLDSKIEGVKELTIKPHEIGTKAQCVPDLAGESDALPSRLLLTEFKSLVVTRPVRNNNTTSNSSNENCQNFKKFKKVAYPGAGSFPHIIGGSDLIAHDRKRNAELEQWLRQEVEVQSQIQQKKTLKKKKKKFVQL
uniref:Nibrin n=1 Tax=Xenopus tropicalis TaxID=8364 RepID=A0A6I8QR41_XENTR